LSLNASALCLGVALGGATKGMALALSHGISAVCWAAASIEMAALALLALQQPADHAILHTPHADRGRADVRS
jgi:hypothetical protein